MNYLCEENTDSDDDSFDFRTYKRIFSRKRFIQIFWMLHSNENASKAQDIRTRVQKVNNFIEYLDEKFRKYFVPGKKFL